MNAMRRLDLGGSLLFGLALLLALDEPARFWANGLLNGFLLLSLALAGALFVAIHFLTAAGWWVVIRRLPEAMAAPLPILALAFAALAGGRTTLYSWMRPEAAGDPALAAKSAYLNQPFLLLRAAVILALWSLFGILLRRASLAQDRTGDLAAHDRLRRLSALFLPIFALTFSLASFDWLMALEPHWYSTIFAVYWFAGLFLGGIAAVSLAAVSLGKRGALSGRVTASHLHDLGKLLFGFSCFWAYIWVSQYLLIWYANIPEEVIFYTARTRGAWALPFFLVPVLSFMLPFALLLPRAAKRNPRLLAAVAASVLAGRWLDLFVQIGPPVLGAPRFGLIELCMAGASLALFLRLFLSALARAPLLPAGDPYLTESLAHHGG